MAGHRWLARAGAASVLVVAACGGPAPSSAPDASVGPSDAAPSSVPSDSASTLATPGTPYSAADVLATMRDSRRPGGVPDELETDAVAAAVAEQLWTWDGEPWATWTAAGACGPDTCSLDVAGSPPGDAGTDLYSFEIDPSSGAVTLAGTDLHGHPPDLDARLDAVARGALDADRLEGLSLVGVRWRPPPETDRYWLAYRSGGEEGSPRLDVIVDLASGDVIEADAGS
jgi:hypothetical protein